MFTQILFCAVCLYCDLINCSAVIIIDCCSQPVSQLNLMEPDSSAQHLLLDRVVNIRECHPVPLGLKGFIIGGSSF